MKITFKSTLLTLGSVFLFITFLSSCSDIKNAISNGKDFTKADDIKDLENMIMDHITSDMAVIKIDFRKADTDASTFSTHKGVANIHYVDPENAKKEKVIAVNLKDGSAAEDEFYNKRENFREYKGVKTTELGCGKIADNVNAAIQILVSDSISYDGIGSYYIEVNADPAKSKHKFSLEKRTGSDARKVYYDEYNFVADAEGNVKASK